MPGRFQLVTVDVDANPTILQAFQVQAVPVSFAFVQGQPVPLFEGVQPEDQITAVIDQVLALAAQHGVTGTVAVDGEQPADGDAGSDQVQEQPLPPLHQQAFDAIESGDLDGAAAAYREALAQSPADADAKLGLAQVGLMQRTQGVDLQAARAAAAAAPTDVDAQILVADLDLLGGHVEDAFVRLIDTVRVTADADRNKAREHLVELFEVVGTGDERVAKARKSLDERPLLGQHTFGNCALECRVHSSRRGSWALECRVHSSRRGSWALECRVRSSRRGSWALECRVPTNL